MWPDAYFEVVYNRLRKIWVPVVSKQLSTMMYRIHCILTWYFCSQDKQCLVHGHSYGVPCCVQSDEECNIRLTPPAFWQKLSNSKLYYHYCIREDFSYLFAFGNYQWTYIPKSDHLVAIWPIIYLSGFPIVVLGPVPLVVVTSRLSC